MVVDRAKLKAMAIARMRKDMAVSPEALQNPPAPLAREPATPVPPAPVEPPRRTRKPRRPRAIPAQPAPGAPLPDAFLPCVAMQKKYIRLTTANRTHDYRISCPRDYDPAAPIVFVGVKDGANAEYIGLIRPPGNFMWGRKSQLSASDPRVILFDEFYHALQTTGAPPPHMVCGTL